MMLFVGVVLGLATSSIVGAAVEDPLLSEFHVRPHVVLIGDSITEGGFNGEWLGWAALLSDHVRNFRQDGQEVLEIQRDVINRGYGGYTTRSFVPMFADLLHSVQTATFPQPALTTIFLGANDAAFGAGDQNVPVQEYTDILKSFVVYHKEVYPDARVLLITPPAPVCECEYDHGRVGVFPGEQDGRVDASLVSESHSDASKHYGQVPLFRELYMRPNDRNHTITKLYRDAVIRVAEDEGALDSRVGVLDTWEMMFGGDGEYDRDVADSYYHDGLHFNARGDYLMYQGLVGVVAELWPELGF
ncbi:hypothetical protein HDU98_009249 [Podochytrium sp. JEL0797]|nr:hypothetical protein HDU98_009249 [Podochytrium sp. JEL0797]